MLHLNEVFERESPIWSSSPGLPWTEIGYKKKADIRADPDAIRRIRWFWHRVKAKEDIRFPDCCAYVRAQIVAKGKTKVRAVWGYPATITFGEAVFACPLLYAYQKIGSPFAYGFETGIGGCAKLRRLLKANNYLAVDFKSFDKTLPSWLIDVCFDVMVWNIDFGRYQGRGNARAASMIHMFTRLREYAKSTPIRMCNGERYIKESGLASGSYFTQLVGSIANYILLTYAALKNDVRIQALKVLGDDSILATYQDFTPDMVQAVLAPFGVVVNVAKSMYSRNLDNMVFLGYQINEGKPLREREKAFAGMASRALK